MMDALKAQKILNALDSKVRLGIFRAVTRRGPEGSTALKLSTRLGVRLETVIAHLKALTSVDILVAINGSSEVCYAANVEEIAALLQFLIDEPSLVEANAARMNDLGVGSLHERRALSMFAASEADGGSVR